MSAVTRTSPPTPAGAALSRGVPVPKSQNRRADEKSPNERYEALLLHADGRSHEPPVAVSLSSPDGLARDRDFLLGLPNQLDALAGVGPRF
jgi:hypothetical protein